MKIHSQMARVLGIDVWVAVPLDKNGKPVAWYTMTGTTEAEAVRKVEDAVKSDTP